MIQLDYRRLRPKTEMQRIKAIYDYHGTVSIVIGCLIMCAIALVMTGGCK